jgi:hypothetical protein
LTFASEKDGDRRRKSDPVSDADSSTQKPRPSKRANGNPEVGSALRSVYQRTIDEDIPPEMLDLLGKLG